MQNETIDDFTNLLKDTVMSSRVSTRSTPLPLLMNDFKEQIATDPTMALSEKIEQLNKLNKAYRTVVEELIGTN